MITPAGSEMDLDCISIHSSMAEGPINPYYSLWSTDETLNETQKNFLRKMVVVGIGGVLLFPSLVVLGVPPHSDLKEHPTIYKIASCGMLTSLSVLCLLQPLQYIFRKWNQRQTAPTESSPLLAEV